MGTWLVSLNKEKSSLTDESLYFSATRDLEFVTGKILQYSWLRALVGNTKKYRNYKVLDCIERVISPDKEDFTDHAIFCVIGYKKRYIDKEEALEKYNVDEHLFKVLNKVGLLCSISEDNLIGVFGVIPHDAFIAIRQKPIYLRVIESLLVNKMEFWEDVYLLITEGYDWESLLR